MFPVIRTALIACMMIVLAPPPGTAAEKKSRLPFPIGYLDLAGDPRYEKPRAYAGIEVKPLHRPFDGAETGLRGNRVLGRALGVTFTLHRETGEDLEDLKARMDRLHRETGARFFLADLPAEALMALAEHAAGKDLLLFNISEPATDLRAKRCAANVMHIIPSHAMTADALAQFLKGRNWTQILLLRGPLEQDRVLAQAFQNAARKFGLGIIADREFVMGTDPRERDKNNILLLTAPGRYDAVFVADSLGHFARHLQYQTALPRPIVGSEGLVATAWHWAWERHGAPQLNQRFERKIKRRMLDRDWAAWAAIKIIVTAAAETRKTEFAPIARFIKSDAMTLDTYKGSRSSFRPWNNQLRQPILLATHNAVIARAPIAGFLHPTQYMDTLGLDKRQVDCAME